jgi:hypothetical protein
MYWLTEVRNEMQATRKDQARDFPEVDFQE